MKQCQGRPSRMICTRTNITRNVFKNVVSFVDGIEWFSQPINLVIFHILFIFRQDSSVLSLTLILF